MPNEPIQFNKPLSAANTNIPGLLIIDLPVHGDNRGWFKENWQRAKQREIGLPDFGPIQNNISFNADRGVTRGFHAEPWDKYISIGAGKIFGAWVDLREGETFGTVFTAELDASKAIYVPRGVGNAFQALESNTVYTYLVNDHWSAEAQEQYTFVNLGDEDLAIEWPIPLDQAEFSDKDKYLPKLADVKPMPPRRILITGANGQVGRALRKEFPNAEFVMREEFDIADKNIEGARQWRQYEAIINAAAYTAVDAAETPDGRREAWANNAVAVANLSRIASLFNLTLIHYSTDYVFDGQNNYHHEEEPFSPLGIYGQTKAAGEIAARIPNRHYILRTGWVVGDGNNFVRTMQRLADQGAQPKVVDDQIGRLTFTSDLAKATKHLLTSEAPYGVYNFTNDGESVSWAKIASLVFEASGRQASDVQPISTREYFAGKQNVAPRPLQSTLNLDKIKQTGFAPRDWHEALIEYLRN